MADQAVVTLCCAFLLFCCSAIPSLITVHYIRKTLPDQTSSTAARLFELPNNATALVDGRSIVISDPYATIKTTRIVMERVVEYLFSEISNHQPRCSPYVQQDFFPDGHLAVSVCLRDNVFQYRIAEHEERGNFLQFYVELKPRPVDDFLKKFKDVVV